MTLKEKVLMLRQALVLSLQMHYSCADDWYSCPLSEEGCSDERQKGCNCGADIINNGITKALEATK